MPTAQVVWHLRLPGDPVLALDAATKQYVDGQSPASYLGQIATRCGPPDGNSGNTITQFLSRSRHIARDSVTAVTLVFANWFVSNNLAAPEFAQAGTATLTASIEYPVGTFTQVKFAGSATGSIATGASLVSDAASVVIPAGAAFFVRAYYLNASGILYRAGGDDQTNGEGCEYGSSGITDKTMSGSVGAYTSYTYPPVAILAQTKRPSVFLAGDSRVAGLVETSPFTDTGADYGAGRIVGQAYGYINAGVSGDRVNWAVGASAYTKRLTLAQYCSHILCNYGVNDLANSRTAAQVLADHQTFYAMFGGKPILQTTIYPVTTSSDSWATTANQTLSAWNAARITLNAGIRAVPVGCVGILDEADVVETARDSGKWNSPGWTSDGLHALQLGSRLIASAVRPTALALIQR